MVDVYHGPGHGAAVVWDTFVHIYGRAPQPHERFVEPPSSIGARFLAQLPKIEQELWGTRSKAALPPELAPASQPYGEEPLGEVYGVPKSVTAEEEQRRAENTQRLAQERQRAEEDQRRLEPPGSPAILWDEELDG